MNWKQLHKSKGLFLGHVKCAFVAYNGMRARGSETNYYIGYILLPQKEMIFYGETEQAVMIELENAVHRWLKRSNLIQGGIDE